MKKEFYIGQPLIVKKTGEQVNFIYYDECDEFPCTIFKKDRKGCHIEYYGYEQLDPSTIFKFSELMTGLEQGHFEVGTTFRRVTTDNVLTVKQSCNGLYLQGGIGLPLIIIILYSFNMGISWR